MFDNHIMVCFHEKSICSSNSNQRVIPLTKANDTVDAMLITNSATADKDSVC